MFNKLYIAIYSSSIGAKHLIAFTPKIMRWDSSLWLLDLSSCMGYWAALAARAHQSVDAMLIQNLQRQLVLGSNEGEGASVGSDIAVLAQDPLKAILLLLVMQRRDLKGVIDIETKFAQAIYRSISFDEWWQFLEQLANHLKKNSGFRPQQFSQQIKNMERIVKKMLLDSPFELAKINRAAIARRFGRYIGVFFEHAFGESSASEPAYFEKEDFPWRDYCLPQKPAIARSLDYPLTQWSQIKPLLAADLNKLCDSLNSDSRVLNLVWRIVCYDMSSRDIPILFRHPHSLHGEMPHQETALLQAYYSFRDMVPEDFVCEPLALVSWRLTVEAKISSSPVSAALFVLPDLDHAALAKLENRLDVRLSRFAIFEDWGPEGSFKEVEGDYMVADGWQQGPFWPSFKALGKKRPLFIYNTPISLEQSSLRSKKRFLERIAVKWWSKKTTTGGGRDYYRLLDGKNRAIWAFFDAAGGGYIHGIFA